MIARARYLVLMLSLAASSPAMAQDAALLKDLTSVLALLGQPCGQVVSARRQADNDHIASCKDGTIRHFWSGEGGKETADPGQDSHDAPDMSGLWVILDTTPEGRGTDWYPKLDDK